MEDKQSEKYNEEYMKRMDGKSTGKRAKSGYGIDEDEDDAYGAQHSDDDQEKVVRGCMGNLPSEIFKEVAATHATLEQNSCKIKA